MELLVDTSKDVPKHIHEGFWDNSPVPNKEYVHSVCACECGRLLVFKSYDDGWTGSHHWKPLRWYHWTAMKRLYGPQRFYRMFGRKYA